MTRKLFWSALTVLLALAYFALLVVLFVTSPVPVMGL